MMRQHASITTTVRLARFDEAAELSELLATSYAPYQTTFPWPGLWGEYFAEVTDVAERWGQSRILVAERAGTTVGSVDYYCPLAGGYADHDTLDWVEPDHRDRFAFDPGWAAVRFLAVAPETGGAGIGRTLMTELIGRAEADGASHVFLHSLPIMTTAIDLYTRMGFQRRPERDFGIRDGGSARVLGFLLTLAGTR